MPIAFVSLSFLLVYINYVCAMKFMAHFFYRNLQTISKKQAFVGGVFILVLLLNGISTSAQSLSADNFFGTRTKNSALIDTLMKKSGFTLLQKEMDTAASSVSKYYTSVEKIEDDKTWVRSFSYTEIKTEHIDSRLTIYRTYNKEEYQKFLVWLFEHQFTTVKNEDIKGGKYAVYKNSDFEVRVSAYNKKTDGGRLVKMYEFEF
ncbi:MAG: hypothetical protein K2P88_01240 [Chitinophagaceae bacterium]|uniref:hypothetical protein n=1 Tax=unclassified Paraflavitalea TaxID=2798305 RepID=UPI003D3372B1|nr:hypothetical protein [Chitinophagaceae bacterium]